MMNAWLCFDVHSVPLKTCNIVGTSLRVLRVPYVGVRHKILILG